jgi:nucleoid-associated protein YgaU
VKLYTLIIEGTNAKAAVDPTFAKITDPDRIEPGQKLWIPARPAGS